MKKVVFYTGMLLCLCFSNSVYSQKLDPNEVQMKLVKEWTATEVGVPGEAMLSKENKEVMDFKADGTLQIQQESKMMGIMTIDAKWAFDKKKQRLIMTIAMDGREETQSLEILELTDSHLVLASANKQTAYVPTDMLSGENKASTEAVGATMATGAAMDPDSWSGQLQYTLVILSSDENELEKEISGLLTLSMVNGVRTITKEENGKSVTWTISSDMEMAGMMRYTAECSDPMFSGDITFQNGGMMVEKYDPPYLSFMYLAR